MATSDEQRFPWIRSLAVSLIAGGFYFALNNWSSISSLFPSSLQLPFVPVPPIFTSISLVMFYLFSLITVVKLLQKYEFGQPGVVSEREVPDKQAGKNSIDQYDSTTNKRLPRFDYSDLHHDLLESSEYEIVTESEMSELRPITEPEHPTNNLLDVITDYTIDESYNEILKENGYNVGQLPQNIHPSECKKLGASVFITNTTQSGMDAANVSYETIINVGDVNLSDDKEKETFINTIRISMDEMGEN